MGVAAVSGILDTTIALVFTYIAYKTGAYIHKYTPYSYPNARIKAMEAKLFDEQRFNELAESRNLENFVASLEDTAYREYLTTLGGDITPWNIERALDEALADTYLLMAKIMPGRVRDFFKLLADRWDVKNIVNVVKARAAGEDPERYIVEAGSLFGRVQAMAEAKTPEEMLVALEGTQYAEPYQRYLLGEISLAEFETKLYRRYCGTLKDYVSSRKGDERVILEEFMRLRVERVNVLTILRAKRSGIPPEVIERFILPGGKLKLEPLINAEDLGMALAELDSTEYGKVIWEVRETVEKDLTVIEPVLSRYILRRMRDMERFYPLSVATAVAYTLEKEEEVRKLKAIAKLIHDGVEPDRIKELVSEAELVEEV